MDVTRGTLLPQPVIRAAGREMLLDEATGDGCRLLLDARRFSDMPALPQWLAAASVGGAQLGETGDVLGSWFSRYEVVAALVRPDHYVYGSAWTVSEAFDLAAEAGRVLGF